MSSLLRQVLLLSLSATLSWWFLLRAPEQVPAPAQAAPPAPELLALALTPVVDEPEPEAPSGAPTGAPIDAPGEAPAPEPPIAEPDESREPSAPAPADPPPEPAPEPAVASAEESDAAAPEAAPAGELAPPPELGSPDAAPDPETVATTRTPEEPADEPASAMRSDPELLALAHLELAGESRLGFQSVLLAAPEDQVDIARAFGEELVLVPFSAIDPESESPHYFRLTLNEDGDAQGVPSVETVTGAPPLARYRQYRDLFEYEYARLPPGLRALRRSVLSRSEVFLFAALIPTSEWALVIGRRREALARAGRELEQVQRVVLAYVSRPGGYDIQVERIEFADGTRLATHETNPED